MRNLQLFVDSRLKEFNLYKYMEQILRNGSTEVDTEVSIDEIQSLALFKEFVDLATILDSYKGWTDSQWTNFIVQMMIAFKEKGKPDSVNCALASLGISTEGTAVLENVDELHTKLTLRIKNMDTPNVTYFIERFEALLPKLLWTHELDTSGVTVEQVSVEIILNAEYERTMFDRAVRYSVLSGNKVSIDNANWGV